MAFKIVNSEVITDIEQGKVEELWINGTQVLIGDGLGNVTLQNVTLDGSVAPVGLTTDGVNEGVVNLYYTDARVDANFATKTTTELSEGTNLYYTDARVDAIVDPQVSTLNSAITTGDAVTLSAAQAYTDAAVSAGTGLLTTDDIPEASNLYYTDLRVDARIGLQTGVNLDLSSKTTSELSEGANLYFTNARVGTYLTTNNYAVEAYADGVANTAESNANNYTDTRETAITNAYVASDVSVLSTANLYTDGKTTKAYIDALGIQATSVALDSVALGTDTTGNYVSTITGTLNEVEVTGSGTENAAVTVGLPSNVTVTNDLTVGGDLFVTGTTISIGAANLSVDDSFIYLNQGDAIGPDNTTFTGTGINDGVLKGYYEGPTTTTYYVRIDGTGTPDTFEWSKDNFATTEATGVAITGLEQDLDYNIKIEFVSTTGHTLGDVWSGTAAPLNVDSGIFTNRNTGTTGAGYTHMGVFYDASAERWKVFSEYDQEPNGDINTGDASFVLGKMEADCFIANDVDINGPITNAVHATNKSYVDSADATILSSAQAYADQAESDAITSANAYSNARDITAASFNTSDGVLTLTKSTGNVTVDLDGRYSQTDTTYNAGTNISIVGNTINNTAPDQTVTLTSGGATSISGTYPNFTISSTDTNTTYTAGAGLSLVGTQFSMSGSYNGNLDLGVNKILYSNVYPTTGDLPSAASYHGMFAHVHGTGAAYFAHAGNWVQLANQSSIPSYTAGNGLSLVGTTFAMSGSFTGDFTATGDVTAYSDRNLKRNIVSIDSALDKVMAMRGVMFEKDGRHSTGVIAQEMEQVLPEVVHTDADGMKSVAYGNIVGTLIEAIKEQQEIIEDLKKEIDNIKKS